MSFRWLQAAPALPSRAVAGWRAMPRRAKIGFSAAGLIILFLILFLWLFDWNWLRGPVGAVASARLGRPVSIIGDLDVHPWSLKPRIEANDVRIAQPVWVKADNKAPQAGDMARIGRIAVQIELPPLFAGRAILSRLEITRPRIALIRLADGRANWTFGGKGSGGSMKLPAIRRFIISDGQLTLKDAKRRTTFSGTVHTDEQAGGAGRGVFALRGEGRLNGAVFRADITGDPLLNVSPSRPYPFRADVRAGATRITATARILRPFDLGRFDGDLTVAGSDLNDLYGLTGLTLPNTPPYRVAGRLTRRGTLWRLDSASGRIGDSDLAGDLSVQTRGERPMLTADLRSRRLDFDDLGSLFGGAPGARKGETASPEQAAMADRRARTARLFPDATLQVDRLRAMDARVTYRADAVNAPNLPLTKVALTLDLKEGVLTGDPVSLSFSRGSVSGMARLDARGDTPRTDLDLRVTGARLEDWIPLRTAGKPAIEGQVVARARLTGHGNSVRKAAASADGTLTFVAPGGAIRQAFAELLGVNVSKGLLLLLSEDPRQTPIRCAVADFKVTNGIARANRIILDTGVVRVNGQGVVDLRTERIDLTLEGESKKPRLLRLFIPIHIEGPLMKPKIDLRTGDAIVQGGVAAALATFLSPLAAILPFVEPGLARDANCAALIAEGRAKGAPVKASARR